MNGSRRNALTALLACLLGTATTFGGTRAQSPAPLSPAERPARRFPQPVRVGDLVDREILEPREAQPVIGHVAALARRPDGGADVVIRLGGWLGLGTRDVAVPLEAVGLLGEHVALLDVTPDQARALPRLDLASAPVIARDAVIRVGLAKPFH